MGYPNSPSSSHFFRFSIPTTLTRAIPEPSLVCLVFVALLPSKHTRFLPLIRFSSHRRPPFSSPLFSSSYLSQTTQPCGFSPPALRLRLGGLPSSSSYSRARYHSQCNAAPRRRCR